MSFWSADDSLAPNDYPAQAKAWKGAVDAWVAAGLPEMTDLQKQGFADFVENVKALPDDATYEDIDDTTRSPEDADRYRAIHAFMMFEEKCEDQ